MKKSYLHNTAHYPSVALVFCLCLVLTGQGCKKETAQDPDASRRIGATFKKKPPTPPAAVFYFTNCNSNPTYSAAFMKGVATNTSITKNYVNSPGGSYAAFTSQTVNGITVTATAGTFNTGSGSVVFTATGTPVATGYYNVWIQVGNIQPCMMFFTVGNPPVSGPNADPGPVAGSTGIVNFTYKGQAVAYSTVRAKDGKIWLQQNLGSPQVAFHHLDEASYGDYFQWGRWDDGHQSSNSATVTGGPSLVNPSHISSGYSSFIKGATAATRWWGSGGAGTDTWNGTTVSPTNGKDPCAALGAGWHMPTATEWQTLMSYEDLAGTMAAFQSTLKLPATGYRLMHDGFVYKNGDNGNYWSSTAINGFAKLLNYDDNTYAAVIGTSERAQGCSCRCVK